MAITLGTAWVIPDAGEPLCLHPGDVAIMRGPDSFTFGDSPSTPVQVDVHPGPRRTTRIGEYLPDIVDLGPRTWGYEITDDATVMLIGKYQMTGEISRRLLCALPPVLVVPRGQQGATVLLELLAEEVAREEPGQQAVLDRILDLLLVSTLRSWFACSPAQAPAEYRAISDLVIGPALHHLHNAPAHPWTVATLASRVGISRATLAHRFADLVGQPPMTYLTAWRLDLAADLLYEPETTIESAARQVGYSSASALSAAFKRERGISPRQLRARLHSTN